MAGPEGGDGLSIPTLGFPPFPHTERDRFNAGQESGDIESCPKLS